MKIAIDVGYSFTKGVNERNEKIIIPSAITSGGTNNLLSGVFSNVGPGHRLEVRSADGSINRFKIGELALKSFSSTTSLSKEKPIILHDTLILGACALLKGGSTGVSQERIDLRVGLPLAYFKSQKEELRQRLEGLVAWVTLNEEKERYISFEKVSVFPQGVGVVFDAGLRLSLTKQLIGCGRRLIYD